MLGASTRSSSCAFDQETIETAACGSEFENHGREVRQLNQVLKKLLGASCKM
jgi:hypothetical protein